MEGVIGIIAIIIIWSVVSWIFSAVGRTMRAAGRSLKGEGSFAQNLQAAFKGAGPMELRLQDGLLDEDEPESPKIKAIQGKGLFPTDRKARVGFVTSVLDKTSGEYEPVISAIEAFQEQESIVYQHRAELGEIEPGQGFSDWVRLGMIIPEILQPPYSGERQLVAVLRMIDMDQPPGISHGFHDADDPGLLWQDFVEFTHTFTEKGYSEAAEHRDEATGLALKIGVAVAMADGSLDDEEGVTLRNWIIRAIEPFTEEKQEELKTLYNNALKDAYAQAQDGSLSLSPLTERLNEIGEKTIKYEAIELCYDIMAADGVADAEEIKTIRRVAEALELDLDEIDKIRDQKIIGLDTNISEQASIEDLLGIEADWDAARIKKHLRMEFQKWNNRLNTLTEGDERDNAQRMLDLIAEARQKYAK